MADSAEQLNLKKRARRRLVGAIALITFVVIVLPMVFDKEAKPLPSDVSVQIPSPDNSTIPHKVVPALPVVVPVTPGQAPATAPAPPQAAAQAPAVAPVTAAPVVASAPAPAPAATPKAIPTPAPLVSAQAKTPAAGKAAQPAAKAPAVAAAAPAAAKTEVPAKSDAAAKANAGHWGVKLGTFADAANAKRQQAKATEAKFKTYTEALDTAEGPRTRVWAGPFDTKAAAEHARDKLKKMGINGLVAEQQAG